MFKKLFIFLLVFGSYVLAQNPVTVDQLSKHVHFLASDKLEGRLPGTEGGMAAANYVESQFKAYGLQPLTDSGFQDFKVVSKVELATKNTMKVGEQIYTVEEDFIPVGFTDNKSLEAGVVFAGYGFVIDTDSLKWDDFSGIDVDGKWVIILRGDPENSPHGGAYYEHSALRKKALNATDNGALGVLFVSGPEYDDEDELMRLAFDQSKSNAGVPVINIKRSVADFILAGKGTTIAELEKKLNSDKKANSFEIPVTVSASAEVNLVKVQTRNVLAVLPGSDETLKDQYIVVGAHYDHLGYGGRGSGSRTPDTVAIHNGADDNASGVSSMLEIAEYFSAMKTKRSILFMAFGAEEMGLLGSKYFVNNPLIDLKKIDIMYNLDMVGRLDSVDKGLTLGGTGTAEGLEDFIKKESEKFDLKVKTSPEGTGPSDHATFYLENIPVLFFFTGTHDDYHTYRDDSDKINYEGMKKVADFAIDLINYHANNEEMLTFTEAGSKEERRSMRFKVTLGIIPDYASDSGGLRLDGVNKDGPADKAGMQKGDIVVKMGDKPVSNIYDYMARLGEFKKGEQVVVEVLRGDEKLELNVTF
ncbi:MAG: M20/M25/M40 family metallo-hydrolase [Calditrichae bacterium]|nr:M20/M25/M40 family metallo-hydrolase [Calditrichota bacterium]MCB9058989.1 M20/M25/M40 family metallo-hydrolase [Calditrichia bacterium]